MDPFHKKGSCRLICETCGIEYVHGWTCWDEIVILRQLGWPCPEGHEQTMNRKEKGA